MTRIRLFLLAWAAVSAAIAAEPVRHTVRFPAPQTHYLEISSVFPAPAAGRPLEVSMAVWTPYVIREYARNIEGITAFDTQGRPLVLEKYRKNRWRVPSPPGPVEIRYRLYCRVMSVQDNWVDEEFALLNPAATFLTPVDDNQRPHEVELRIPDRWHRVLTAMPEIPGAPHRFRAEGYEMLTDSPIVAGNPAVHEFTVHGKQHLLVNQGETAEWDGQRATADVQRIVEAQDVLWGSLPYSRYVFLNLITESGGGMEHTDSTAIMTSRWAMGSRDRYVSWLDVVSHEFFHLWNVKRLRPRELVPVDYENEQLTRTLGIAEGFTSYYGVLEVRRAGLTSDAEFLSRLSGTIRHLQTTPGRRQQSLALSSYDTYIKFYRPDENSVNTAISYYTKGDVVAWLLDARVRAATGGRKTLDDVMRLALERYPLPKGYLLEDFAAVAGEVAGTPLMDWFRAAFESTEELDYREALAWFGLRFSADGGPARGWWGANTRPENGRLVVTQVLRDSPAWHAGLTGGDEILSWNDLQVAPDQFEARVSASRPGQAVRVTFARTGRIRTVEFTLGTAPPETWNLEIDPAASAAARAHFAAWVSR